MVVKVDNIEELKEQLTSRKLILYGMGTIGMEIARWCDSNHIGYIFADRNALEKQGLVKKAVVTPEVIISDFMDANIVISTNIYFEEIKERLIKNGFCEKQILSYALFVPKTIVWSDLENNIDWNLMRPSVELFSRWIDAGIRSVVDYGAGQMYLKNFLNPGVKYYPVDYMKRFDETIVCDLNKGNFPEINADMSVFNGVLEFLTTAESLLNHTCSRTANKVMISYMTLDKFPSKTARRASGYVSDLNEEQIIHILSENGFRLTKKESDPLDNTDTLYLFEKKCGECYEIC